MIRSPALRLLYLALLVEGGLAVSAVMTAVWVDVDPWGSWRWESVAAVVGAGATVPWLGFFHLSLRSRHPSLTRIRELLDTYLRPLLHGAGPVTLALVSVLAGVGEEMFFRAVLQGYLAETLGTAPALAVASLVFGLCHALTPTYFVVTTVMGAYLGGLWLWTGNLLAPVVCHALYDFVALLLYRRRAQSEDESSRS